MFAIRPVACASALALLSAGSAHAALTAGQVWQSWKDGAAESGVKLTAATEAESGGTLTLNGITLAPEGAETPLTISDMTLTEQADGSVLVTPGASIGVEKHDGDKHVLLKLAHEGLTLVVRETGAEGMAYDIAADRASLVFDVSEPSESSPAEPMAGKGTINVDALRGTWSDSAPDARDIALKLTAAGTDYDMTFADPDESTASTVSASAEAPAVDFALHLPEGYSFDAEDAATSVPRMLSEGFSVNLALSQGNSKSVVNARSDEFGTIDITTEWQPATSLFRLDRDAFLVTADYGAMSLSASAAELPVPVKLTMESLGFKLQSPILAAEEAGDYAAVLRLAKLAVNDELWGLVDPGAALRHDPLDLVIDLGGKVKIDWLAIATAEETGEEPPVPAPETLDIHEVALKIAGAALAADGAFTFDNSAGFPMPLGMAKVTVSGATQLIDGLVAIGLLPEEEAQGVSMMMGMFMKPGSEPDTMTSTIEAKEGGEITVNGMAIPF